MNTGVVNQNLNFNQTSSNTNTSSSITGVSVNNKASTTNTTTSNNNSQIESMDLSFATENTNNNDDITKVANGFSKIVEGFNDIGNGTLGLINTADATLAKTAANIGSEVKSVISDAKNMVVDKAKDIIDTAASIGNKVKSGVKDFFGNIIDGLKGIGSTLKETCSNIASNASTILGNIGNWAKDTAASIGSTAAVVGTSVVSGIANLGEGIVDGLAWTGGKIVEGGSWLVGKVAGLFSKDAEESVMDWREEAKTGVKEFIATDWVGEANKAFYENTDIGRAINENSYLKYDSKIAQGISGVTETIGKIALATAATIGTGGAAAPLALGFLFGTGEKAEKLYQENINTTGAQELGIFISGLGEAANWYAQGKLGEGAVGLFNVIKNTGLKQTGALAINGVKSLIGNIKTNGIGNTLKGMLGSTKVSSMMAADNLADSAGIIGDNTSRWLTGEEEFNLGNVAKAGGELLSAWSLNMFFDGASDYLMNGGKIKEMPELQSSSPSPSIQSHSDIDFTTSTSLTDVGNKLEEMVQSKYGKSFLDLTDYGYDANKIRYGKEIADGMEAYHKLSLAEINKNVTRKYIDDFLKDPTTPAPQGVSQEIVDYLTKYAKDPDITAPMGIPKEVIDYIANKNTIEPSISDSTLDLETTTNDTDVKTSQIGTITTETTPTKLLNMDEVDIQKYYEDKKLEIDITDSHYFEKCQLLDQQKDLNIKLAQKLKGVSTDSTSPKNIDLLTPSEKIQVETTAKQIFDKAAQEEPSVSALMKSLEGTDAKLVGYEHRFKTLDGIQDKIARNLKKGYSLTDINDSLRYTLIVDESAYTDTVIKKLAQLRQSGYDIKYVNNHWGSKGLPTYQGLNITLLSPEGSMVELQFHTQASFDIKQTLNHDFYEISRNKSLSPDIIYLSDQIQEINQKLYVTNPGFDIDNTNTLNQAIDAYLTGTTSKFKNYMETNGYHHFIQDNQDNFMSWEKALVEDPYLKEAIHAYKGESMTHPASYKIINSYYRGTLFDDARKTVTRTGTGGYPYIVSYAEFEKEVGCSIPEFKAKIEESAQKLSQGIGKCHLRTDTQLIRGVNMDTLKYKFGISESDSLEAIIAKIQAKGNVWIEEGYSSACPRVADADLPWIASDKQVQLIMDVESDIDAKIFGTPKYGDYEMEIILDKNQTFDISKIEEKNGKIYIYMTHRPKN